MKAFGIKRRRAFTMAEIVIGMVAFTIVMGGILAVSTMGVRIFGKAEANAKAVNGARFTVEAFKETIWPMLGSVYTSIDVWEELPSDGDLKPGDCYVYYDEEKRALATVLGGEKEPLPGSEFISDVEFSLSTVSGDAAEPEDYVLKLKIEAQDPDDPQTRIELEVDSALYGKPKKDGDRIEGDRYVGKVLHFNVFHFSNLRLIDVDNNEKVVENNEAVDKGNRLRLEYDIVLPPGMKDATKILWYISDVYGKSVDKAFGYYEDKTYDNPTYTDDTRSKYRWPLMASQGQILSEAYMNTGAYDIKFGSGKFMTIATDDPAFFKIYNGTSGPLSSAFDLDTGSLKTYHSGAAQKFGMYGFIEAWVVPAYSKQDGSGLVIPEGYEQWSNKARIGNSSNNKIGQQFFNEWMAHLIEKPDGNESVYMDLDNDPDFEAYAKIDDEGNYSGHIAYSGNNTHAKIGAALKPEHIADARNYEQTFMDSYSCITNYSIILDVTCADTTAGLGVVLNGFRKEGDSNEMSGYAFQYDPGANGFVIRLQDKASTEFSDSQPDGWKYSYIMRGAQAIWSPVQLVINDYGGGGDIGNKAYYCSGLSPRTVMQAVGQNDASWVEPRMRQYFKYYNSQYHISALRNDVFDYTPSTAIELYSSDGDHTKEAKLLQGRQRFIITVLEYYANDDPTRPRLLVRAKLLKDVETYHPSMTYATTPSDPYLHDPYAMGPQYFRSEPTWFGKFVGQRLYYDNYSNTKWDWTTWTNVTTTYNYYYGVPMRSGKSNATKEGVTYTQDDVYKIDDNPFVDSYFIKRDGNTPGYTTDEFYIMQAPNTSDTSRNYCGPQLNLNDQRFTGLLVKGIRLAPREDMEEFHGTGYDVGDTSADRYRWIGLSLWGGTLGGISSIAIHDMRMAPGFSDDEIRAILESGGQVYGMDETNNDDFNLSKGVYDSTEDTHYKWNKVLFGPSQKSDGNGNTEYAQKFKKRFVEVKEFKGNNVNTWTGRYRSCVQSLQHTSANDTSKDCGCPMCYMYFKYKEYEEKNS